MKQKQNLKGFTIVELVISLVLIGFALIIISNIFINLGTINRQAYHLLLANNIAQQKIETYRQTAYNSIPTGSPAVTFTDELPTSLRTPKNAYINISEIQPGLKQIDVYITYTDGATKNIEKSTYITQEGLRQ